MTQIQHPSQTNPSLHLSPDLLQKLAATLSNEEYNQVMSSLMEKNQTQETTGYEETPNQVYARLRHTFRLDLEGATITRKKAAEKYDLAYATVALWEEKGLVKDLEKSKGQGSASGILERDMAEMRRLFRTEGNKTGTIKGFKPPKIN